MKFIDQIQMCVTQTILMGLLLGSPYREQGGKRSLKRRTYLIER